MVEAAAVATRLLVLNEKQLAVLAWIARGCPPDEVAGSSYKTTAIALQSRKLVRISKRAGAWSATVTDAGRYFLEHGTVPPAPVAAPIPVERDKVAPPRPVVSRPPKAAIGTRRPTEQLIHDVIAAGGELAVQRDEHGRPDYPQLVASAIRFRKVPSGKLLLLEDASWARAKGIVRLVDLPVTAPVGVPVPVPESLRRPSPIVVDLRNSSSAFRVQGKARGRALRILQGLVTALHDAGASCTPGVIGGTNSTDNAADVRVTVNGDRFGLRLAQVIERTRHVLTGAEEAARARNPYAYVPKYEETLTERLSLRIVGGFEYGRSVWSDGARGRLEDHLSEAIHELFARSVIAARTEEARLQREAEARQRQELARQRAITRLNEDHRRERLSDQAGRWREVQSLREYVAAMRTAIDRLPPGTEEREAAGAWCAWASDYIAAIDPLRQSLAMPPDPEPTLTALRPYLDAGGFLF